MYIFEDNMPMGTYTNKYPYRAPQICVTKDSLRFVKFASTYRDKRPHLMFLNEFSSNLNTSNQWFSHAKYMRAALCGDQLFVELTYLESTKTIFRWNPVTTLWGNNLAGKGRDAVKFTRESLEAL